MMKSITEHLKSSRLLYLTGLAVLVCTTILGLYIPIVIGGVLDDVIYGNVLPAIIWKYAVFVVLLYMINYIFRYAQSGLITFCTANIGQRLQMRFLRHVISLPQKARHLFHTGDLIQRAGSDIDAAQGFYTRQLIIILQSILIMAAVFIMSIRINANITLLYIPLSVIVFLITLGVFDRYIKKRDEQERLWSKMSSIAQESLSAYQVIRTFGRIEAEQERFAAAADNAESAAFAYIKLATITTNTQDLLCQIQAVLILILGIVSITKGEMTVGELTIMISFSTLLLDSLRQFAGSLHHGLGSSYVGYKRINEVFSEPTEDISQGVPVKAGDINIRNLSFSYDGSREILKDISLEVKQGEMIGILGGTGSGKSTLFALLTGCYRVPEGSIFIGGTDINKTAKKSLRRHIGWIHQKPFLFSGTVTDNLSMTGETDMEQACHTACAGHLIDREVSFAGNNFSGGERQRIAMAAVLARKPKILLIDDALSALDAQTAATVQRRLTSEKIETTIIISNRISALIKCDKIYVMENGRISQSGTHMDLINQKGLYADIYRLQSEVQ